ncbi:MAG TPA: hypothetical protein VEI03_06395 [Stellaceae bacterium]|nr:hypothetical protein [Stellaceae bacterium]
MKRFFPAALSILLLAAGLSACGGAYTSPSQGIAADIQASRLNGSASLVPSANLNFRDSDFAH